MKLANRESHPMSDTENEFDRPSRNASRRSDDVVHMTTQSDEGIQIEVQN